MAWRCPLTSGSKGLQALSALQCSSGGSAAAMQTKPGGSHAARPAKANPCKRKAQAESTRKAAPPRRNKARAGSTTTSEPLAADDPCNGTITTSAHVIAHGARKRFCWRCQMGSKPETLRNYASFQGSSWLTMGTHRGLVGLGCRFCATHKMSPSVRRASGGHDSGRFSVFANCQFRPTVM